MPSPTIPMGSKQYSLNTRTNWEQGRHNLNSHRHQDPPSATHQLQAVFQEGQANLLALQALDIIVITKAARGKWSWNVQMKKIWMHFFFFWDRVQCSKGEPQAGWAKDEPEITIGQLPPHKRLELHDWPVCLHHSCSGSAGVWTPGLWCAELALYPLSYIYSSQKRLH